MSCSAGGTATCSQVPAKVALLLTVAAGGAQAQTIDRTNGKPERFIQTDLREWTYARAYQSLRRRADALPTRTHFYKWHRPHGGIGDQTPISQFSLTQNNLMTLHI